jgi:hypothetical protein
LAEYLTVDVRNHPKNSNFSKEKKKNGKEKL